MNPQISIKSEMQHLNAPFVTSDYKEQTKLRRHNSTSKMGEKVKDTYISHVLAQKVLQCLTHRVAFRHNALPAVITCARGISHEGSSTNNAFKALLQRRTKALLAERQRVNNDLFLSGRHKKKRFKNRKRKWVSCCQGRKKKSTELILR